MRREIEEISEKGNLNFKGIREKSIAEALDVFARLNLMGDGMQCKSVLQFI